MQTTHEVATRLVRLLTSTSLASHENVLGLELLAPFLDSTEMRPVYCCLVDGQLCITRRRPRHSHSYALQTACIPGSTHVSDYVVSYGSGDSIPVDSFVVAADDVIEHLYSKVDNTHDLFFQDLSGAAMLASAKLGLPVFSLSLLERICRIPQGLSGTALPSPVADAALAQCYSVGVLKYIEDRVMRLMQSVRNLMHIIDSQEALVPTRQQLLSFSSIVTACLSRVSFTGLASFTTISDVVLKCLLANNTLGTLLQRCDIVSRCLMSFLGIMKIEDCDDNLRQPHPSPDRRVTSTHQDLHVLLDYLHICNSPVLSDMVATISNANNRAAEIRELVRMIYTILPFVLLIHRVSLVFYNQFDDQAPLLLADLNSDVFGTIIKTFARQLTKWHSDQRAEDTIERMLPLPDYARTLFHTFTNDIVLAFQHYIGPDVLFIMDPMSYSQRLSHVQTILCRLETELPRHYEKTRLVTLNMRLADLLNISSWIIRYRAVHDSLVECPYPFSNSLVVTARRICTVIENVVPSAEYFTYALTTVLDAATVQLCWNAAKYEHITEAPPARLDDIPMSVIENLLLKCPNHPLIVRNPGNIYLNSTVRFDDFLVPTDIKHGKCISEVTSFSSSFFPQHMINRHSTVVTTSAVEAPGLCADVGLCSASAATLKNATLGKLTRRKSDWQRLSVKDVGKVSAMNTIVKKYIFVGAILQHNMRLLLSTIQSYETDGINSVILGLQSVLPSPEAGGSEPQPHEFLASLVKLRTLLQKHDILIFALPYIRSAMSVCVGMLADVADILSASSFNPTNLVSFCEYAHHLEHLTTKLCNLAVPVDALGGRILSMLTRIKAASADAETLDVSYIDQVCTFPSTTDTFLLTLSAHANGLFLYKHIYSSLVRVIHAMDPVMLAKVKRSYYSRVNSSSNGITELENSGLPRADSLHTIALSLSSLSEIRDMAICPEMLEFCYFFLNLYASLSRARREHYELWLQALEASSQSLFHRISSLPILRSTELYSSFDESHIPNNPRLPPAPVSLTPLYDVLCFLDSFRLLRSKTLCENTFVELTDCESLSMEKPLCDMLASSTLPLLIDAAHRFKMETVVSSKSPSVSQLFLAPLLLVPSGRLCALANRCDSIFLRSNHAALSELFDRYSTIDAALRSSSSGNVVSAKFEQLSTYISETAGKNLLWNDTGSVREFVKNMAVQLNSIERVIWEIFDVENNIMRTLSRFLTHIDSFTENGPAESCDKMQCTGPDPYFAGVRDNNFITYLSGEQRVARRSCSSSANLAAVAQTDLERVRRCASLCVFLSNYLQVNAKKLPLQILVPFINRLLSPLALDEPSLRLPNVVDALVHSENLSFGRAIITTFFVYRSATAVSSQLRCTLQPDLLPAASVVVHDVGTTLYSAGQSCLASISDIRGAGTFTDLCRAIEQALAEVRLTFSRILLGFVPSINLITRMFSDISESFYINILSTVLYILCDAALSWLSFLYTLTSPETYPLIEVQALLKGEVMSISPSVENKPSCVSDALRGVLISRTMQSILSKTSLSSDDEVNAAKACRWLRSLVRLYPSIQDYSDAVLTDDCVAFTRTINGRVSVWICSILQIPLTIQEFVSSLDHYTPKLTRRVSSAFRRSSAAWGRIPSMTVVQPACAVFAGASSYDSLLCEKLEKFIPLSLVIPSEMYCYLCLCDNVLLRVALLVFRQLYRGISKISSVKRTLLDIPQRLAKLHRGLDWMVPNLKTITPEYPIYLECVMPFYASVFRVQRSIDTIPTINDFDVFFQGFDCYKSYLSHLSDSIAEITCGLFSVNSHATISSFLQQGGDTVTSSAEPIIRSLENTLQLCYEALLAIEQETATMIDHYTGHIERLPSFARECANYFSCSTTLNVESLVRSVHLLRCIAKMIIMRGLYDTISTRSQALSSHLQRNGIDTSSSLQSYIILMPQKWGALASLCERSRYLVDSVRRSILDYSIVVNSVLKRALQDFEELFVSDNANQPLTVFNVETYGICNFSDISALHSFAQNGIMSSEDYYAKLCKMYIHLSMFYELEYLQAIDIGGKTRILPLTMVDSIVRSVSGTQFSDLLALVRNCGTIFTHIHTATSAIISCTANPMPYFYDACSSIVHRLHSVQHRIDNLSFKRAFVVRLRNWAAKLLSIFDSSLHTIYLLQELSFDQWQDLIFNIAYHSREAKFRNFLATRDMLKPALQDCVIDEEERRKGLKRLLLQTVLQLELNRFPRLFSSSLSQATVERATISVIAQLDNYWSAFGAERYNTALGALCHCINQSNIGILQPFFEHELLDTGNLSMYCTEPTVVAMCESTAEAHLRQFLASFSESAERVLTVDSAPTTGPTSDYVDLFRILQDIKEIGNLAQLKYNERLLPHVVRRLKLLRSLIEVLLCHALVVLRLIAAVSLLANASYTTEIASEKLFDIFAFSGSSPAFSANSGISATDLSMSLLPDVSATSFRQSSTRSGTCISIWGSVLLSVHMGLLRTIRNAKSISEIVSSKVLLPGQFLPYLTPRRFSGHGTASRSSSATNTPASSKSAAVLRHQHFSDTSDSSLTAAMSIPGLRRQASELHPADKQGIRDAFADVNECDVDDDASSLDSDQFVILDGTDFSTYPMCDTVFARQAVFSEEQCASVPKFVVKEAYCASTRNALIYTSAGVLSYVSHIISILTPVFRACSSFSATTELHRVIAAACTSFLEINSRPQCPCTHVAVVPDSVERQSNLVSALILSSALPLTVSELLSESPCNTLLAGIFYKRIVATSPEHLSFLQSLSDTSEVFRQRIQSLIDSVSLPDISSASPCNLEYCSHFICQSTDNGVCGLLTPLIPGFSGLLRSADCEESFIGLQLTSSHTDGRVVTIPFLRSVSAHSILVYPRSHWPLTFYHPAVLLAVAIFTVFEESVRASIMYCVRAFRAGLEATPVVDSPFNPHLVECKEFVLPFELFGYHMVGCKNIEVVSIPILAASFSLFLDSFVLVPHNSSLDGFLTIDESLRQLRKKLTTFRHGLQELACGFLSVTDESDSSRQFLLSWVFNAPNVAEKLGLLLVLADDFIELINWAEKRAVKHYARQQKLGMAQQTFTSIAYYISTIKSLISVKIELFNPISPDPTMWLFSDKLADRRDFMKRFTKTLGDDSLICLCNLQANVPGTDIEYLAQEYQGPLSHLSVENPGISTCMYSQYIAVLPQSVLVRSHSSISGLLPDVEKSLDKHLKIDQHIAYTNRVLIRHMAGIIMSLLREQYYYKFRYLFHPSLIFPRCGTAPGIFIVPTIRFSDASESLFLERDLQHTFLTEECFAIYDDYLSTNSPAQLVANLVGALLLTPQEKGPYPSLNLYDSQQGPPALSMEQATISATSKTPEEVTLSPTLDKLNSSSVPLSMPLDFSPFVSSPPCFISYQAGLALLESQHADQYNAAYSEHFRIVKSELIKQDIAIVDDIAKLFSLFKKGLLELNVGATIGKLYNGKSSYKLHSVASFLSCCRPLSIAHPSLKCVRLQDSRTTEPFFSTAIATRSLYNAIFDVLAEMFSLNLLTSLGMHATKYIAFLAEKVFALNLLTIADRSANCLAICGCTITSAQLLPFILVQALRRLDNNVGLLDASQGYKYLLGDSTAASTFLVHRISDLEALRTFFHEHHYAPNCIIVILLDNVSDPMLGLLRAYSVALIDCIRESHDLFEFHYAEGVIAAVYLNSWVGWRVPRPNITLSPNYGSFLHSSPSVSISRHGDVSELSSIRSHLQKHLGQSKFHARRLLARQLLATLLDILQPFVDLVEFKSVLHNRNSLSGLLKLRLRYSALESTLAICTSILDSFLLDDDFLHSVAKLPQDYLRLLIVFAASWSYGALPLLPKDFLATKLKAAALDATVSSTLPLTHLSLWGQCDAMQSTPSEDPYLLHTVQPANLQFNSATKCSNLAKEWHTFLESKFSNSLLAGLTGKTLSIFEYVPILMLHKHRSIEHDIAVSMQIYISTWNLCSQAELPALSPQIFIAAAHLMAGNNMAFLDVNASGSECAVLESLFGFAFSNSDYDEPRKRCGDYLKRKLLMNEDEIGQKPVSTAHIGMFRRLTPFHILKTCAQMQAIPENCLLMDTLARDIIARVRYHSHQDSEKRHVFSFDSGRIGTLLFAFYPSMNILNRTLNTCSVTSLAYVSADHLDKILSSSALCSSRVISTPDIFLHQVLESSNFGMFLQSTDNSQLLGRLMYLSLGFCNTWKAKLIIYDEIELLLSLFAHTLSMLEGFVANVQASCILSGTKSKKAPRTELRGCLPNLFILQCWFSSLVFIVSGLVAKVTDSDSQYFDLFSRIIRYILLGIESNLTQCISYTDIHSFTERVNQYLQKPLFYDNFQPMTISFRPLHPFLPLFKTVPLDCFKNHRLSGADSISPKTLSCILKKATRVSVTDSTVDSVGPLLKHLSLQLRCNFVTACDYSLPVPTLDLDPSRGVISSANLSKIVLETMKTELLPRDSEIYNSGTLSSAILQQVCYKDYVDLCSAAYDTLRHFNVSASSLHVGRYKFLDLFALCTAQFVSLLSENRLAMHTSTGISVLTSNSYLRGSYAVVSDYGFSLRDALLLATKTMGMPQPLGVYYKSVPSFANENNTATCPSTRDFLRIVASALSLAYLQAAWSRDTVVLYISADLLNTCAITEAVLMLVQFGYSPLLMRSQSFLERLILTKQLLVLLLDGSIIRPSVLSFPSHAAEHSSTAENGPLLDKTRTTVSSPQKHVKKDWLKTGLINLYNDRQRKGSAPPGSSLNVSPSRNASPYFLHTLVELICGEHDVLTRNGIRHSLSDLVKVYVDIPVHSCAHKLLRTGFPTLYRGPQTITTRHFSQTSFSRKIFYDTLIENVSAEISPLLARTVIDRLFLALQYGTLAILRYESQQLYSYFFSMWFVSVFAECLRHVLARRFNTYTTQLAAYKSALVHLDLIQGKVGIAADECRQLTADLHGYNLALRNTVFELDKLSTELRDKERLVDIQKNEIRDAHLALTKHQNCSATFLSLLAIIERQLNKIKEHQSKVNPIMLASSWQVTRRFEGGLSSACMLLIACHLRYQNVPNATTLDPDLKLENFKRRVSNLDKFLKDMIAIKPAELASSKYCSEFTASVRTVILIATGKRYDGAHYLLPCNSARQENGVIPRSVLVALPAFIARDRNTYIQATDQLRSLCLKARDIHPIAEMLVWVLLCQMEVLAIWNESAPTRKAIINQTSIITSATAVSTTLSGEILNITTKIQDGSKRRAELETRIAALETRIVNAKSVLTNTTMILNSVSDLKASWVKERSKLTQRLENITCDSFIIAFAFTYLLPIPDAARADVVALLSRHMRNTLYLQVSSTWIDSTQIDRDLVSQMLCPEEILTIQYVSVSSGLYMPQIPLTEKDILIALSMGDIVVDYENMSNDLWFSLLNSFGTYSDVEGHVLQHGKYMVHNTLLFYITAGIFNRRSLAIAASSDNSAMSQMLAEVVACLSIYTKNSDNTTTPYVFRNLDTIATLYPMIPRTIVQNVNDIHPLASLSSTHMNGCTTVLHMGEETNVLLDTPLLLNCRPGHIHMSAIQSLLQQTYVKRDKLFAYQFDFSTPFLESDDQSWSEMVVPRKFRTIILCDTGESLSETLSAYPYLGFASVIRLSDNIILHSTRNASNAPLASPDERETESTESFISLDADAPIGSETIQTTDAAATLLNAPAILQLAREKGFVMAPVTDSIAKTVALIQRHTGVLATIRSRVTTLVTAYDEKEFIAYIDQVHRQVKLVAVEAARLKRMLLVSAAQSLMQTELPEAFIT